MSYPKPQIVKQETLNCVRISTIITYPGTMGATAETIIFDRYSATGIDDLERHTAMGRAMEQHEAAVAQVKEASA